MSWEFKEACHQRVRAWVEARGEGAVVWGGDGSGRLLMVPRRMGGREQIQGSLLREAREGQPRGHWGLVLVGPQPGARPECGPPGSCPERPGWELPREQSSRCVPS